MLLIAFDHFQKLRFIEIGVPRRSPLQLTARMSGVLSISTHSTLHRQLVCKTSLHRGHTGKPVALRQDNTFHTTVPLHFGMYKMDGVTIIHTIGL